MKRSALFLALALSACAPRLVCETRPTIAYDREKLAAINAEDGIDQTEATLLAWYFVYVQISTNGTLCGPRLDGDVWAAEFRKEGLVMPVRIRIDSETGGATAPGYRAVSLAEATGH